jgi:uncharacterized protein YabN with tetrapyrrole methylase and pyrophosphatase domain
MEKVFHCEHDPRISEYLANIGCREVSLKHLYEDGRPREEVYQEICDTIIEAAQAGTKCAYLAPGNPVFLNTIVFKLRDFTSRHGIPFFVYSGVSSIDTLLTDLFIPIEATGLQCFEATHFVRMKPVIDKRVPLLLFQPGVVEAYDIRRTVGVYLPGVKLLQDTLIELYGTDRKWILLRSAMSTDEGPVISTGVLSDLIEKASHLKLGTLLIPGNWECDKYLDKMR